MMKRSLFSILLCLIAFLGTFGLPHGLPAAQFSFQPIEFPDAVATAAMGINDEGDIVGGYIDQAGNVHGFILDHHGNWTTIDHPDGTFGTSASGINNRGQVVGVYWTEAPLSDPTSPFLFENGVITSMKEEFAGGIDTFDAQGINNQGYVVGLLSIVGEDEGEQDTGYVRYPDGSYWIPTLEEGPFPPEGFEFTDINSRNEIIGFGMVPELDCEHSFLRSHDGSYLEIIYPYLPDDGSIDTQVEGINARGEIVGNWTPADVEALEAGHAFYRGPSGVFTDLNHPDPRAVRTFAAKINASGTIVGFWVDDSGAMHGFAARRAAFLQ